MQSIILGNQMLLALLCRGPKVGNAWLFMKGLNAINNLTMNGSYKRTTDQEETRRRMSS